MLLALPVAVGPLAIHRRLAGQVPIPGDGAVHVFAADEIVINIVRHLGPDGQVVRVIGKNGFGIIIPKQPVTQGGNQERYGGLGIGLHQLDGASAVIHVAGLMLAKAVNAFIGRQFEILLDAERLCFVLDPDRRNDGSALFL